MRNRLVYSLFVAVTMALAGGCASTTQTETKPEQKAAAETKPATTPSAAPAPAPAPAAASGASYNVVRGDHLWGISSKPTIYGNPYQWPLIFKANRDRIKDADLIEPGQVLSIDKNPSNGDVSAAVAHAKQRGEWKLGVSEKSDSDYLARYGR
ncbi:MAG TPA: LysM peptidoglycan-binding domain-containing protein [Burkholderiales bacterium]|nr:LysM peptidoglycan-binding domain-containing protein [Burkholderiales bacterium]